MVIRAPARSLRRSLHAHRYAAAHAARQALALWILAAILLAGFADTAAAQAIRKWVDDEGVTHYSDQAPVSPSAPVERVEVPQSDKPQFDSEQVTDRIQQQAEQFERERKQREREAAQSAERRAIEEALQRQEILAAPKKKKKRRKSKNRPPVSGGTPVLNTGK